MKKNKQSETNERSFQAVHCRIPYSTHVLIKEMSALSGKSLSNFVADALEYYCNCIEGNSNPTNALQIDQFAFKLNNQRKT